MRVGDFLVLTNPFENLFRPVWLAIVFVVW
jgi:hypothetical protein